METFSPKRTAIERGKMRRTACLAALSVAVTLLFAPAVLAQQGDLDCDDFPSRAEAQANLEVNPRTPTA